MATLQASQCQHHCMCHDHGITASITSLLPQLNYGINDSITVNVNISVIGSISIMVSLPALIIMALLTAWALHHDCQDQHHGISFVLLLPVSALHAAKRGCQLISANLIFMCDLWRQLALHHSYSHHSSVGITASLLALAAWCHCRCQHPTKAKIFPTSVKTTIPSQREVV